MKYGLTDHEIDLIKGIFEKTPEVESVFIYGSRAKNTFKKTSDIDLAIVFQNGAKNNLGRLKSEMEDLQIIYEIDLTDESDMLSGSFKAEYERTKQVFYLKGWKMTTLGNLLEKITKGTTPKSFSLDKNDINYIKSESLSYDGIIDQSKFAKITNETNNELKRSKLKENDILISMAGIFLGKCGVVKKEMLPANTNQAVAILTVNPTTDYKFLWFKLRAKESVNYFNSIPSQSAQPNINFEEIKSLPIFLPLPTEQRAIAAVLSSLDDKIDLLHKQNKTLEQTAQAIFKEWFVHFNFPGATGKMIDSELGEIPEGWRVGKLGAEVETILGGTPNTQKSEYWKNGTIPWINSGKVNDFRICEPSTYITEKALEESAAKLMPKGTIVIAITGATLGQVSRLEIDSTGNQSVIGILPNKDYSSAYLYYWILENIANIINTATGGAQQHINKNDINGFNFIIPEKSILEKYREKATPLIEKISGNCFQIQTLSALRDALLPKLMKGEIRVNGLKNLLCIN